MRKLLYVPIIHMEPDLGSLVGSIQEKSSYIVGEERWRKHKETVSAFWDSIANYFDSVEGIEFKIYQDGLMAAGDLGMRIIKEGAEKGSKNYMLVLKLIERGGELRKTEDAGLLLAEYDYISKIVQSKNLLKVMAAYLRYRMRKKQLTMTRDKFIARTVNETLRDDEVGVLFIGAYHDVLAFLAKDIVIEQLKERKKVKAYFEELIHGKEEAKFEALAKYLVSPVGQWTEGES